MVFIGANTKNRCLCELVQHLVATKHKSVDSLYVNVSLYLNVSDKYVSKLDLHQILDCNMSYSKLKHPQSKNSKIKPP